MEKVSLSQPTKFNDWITYHRVAGIPLIHLILVIVIFTVAILTYNEPSTHWISFTRSIMASMIGSVMIIPFIPTC